MFPNLFGVETDFLCKNESLGNRSLAPEQRVRRTVRLRVPVPVC